MKKTEFENMVDKAFWGLEGKYGFKKTKTSFIDRSCFRPTTLSEGTLEPTLQKMGQQVLDHCAELLRGDFTVMPKLQARARKYDLECQRYLSIHKS